MVGATCGEWVLNFSFHKDIYYHSFYLLHLDGDHQQNYGPDFFADDTDGLSRVASIAKGADWMINQLFK